MFKSEAKSMWTAAVYICRYLRLFFMVRSRVARCHGITSSTFEDVKTHLNNTDMVELSSVDKQTEYGERDISPQP